MGLSGLLRFTALFPRRLDPAAVGQPPTLPAMLAPLHAMSLWMLRPAAPWAVGALVLAGLWSLALLSGGAVSDAGLSPLMDVVRFVAAGLVVLNLRRAWGRADDDGRGRLQWLLVGLSALLGSIALMIGAKVLVAVAGFREPPIAWHPLLIDLGLLGFFSGLAASVLYAGALRPLTVIRRVATACSIVTLGLFLAAGLEALLSGGVLVPFALRSGVGSAVALATILSTYRGFVRFVDRVLPLA